MASEGKKKKAQQSGGTMTLTGHLKELRNRIIICVVFLIISFLVGLHFAPDIVSVLTDIGKQYGYTYIYISPQELLLQYFSVALLAGVIITLPLILYQIWAFVQPGLKKNENGLFLTALISGLICFVLGVLFAYKLMLPFMLRFLIEISRGSEIHASVTVGNYMTFLLTIFIIFGIIFELPVVTVLLTQMGLLRVEWMRKARKFVIVLIFFVAAIITPPDIVSQVMVALPMLGLYELSIVICTLLLKFRKNSDHEADEGETDEEDT